MKKQNPGPYIKFSRTIRAWLLAGLVSLLLLLAVRTIVAETYRVASSSMEPTLLEGDVVLASKLSYGPRLPFYPLALPYSDLHLNWPALPYLRAFNYKTPARGELLVFNYPPVKGEISQKLPFVKRLLGMPGDTLMIRQSRVFINGLASDQNATLSRRYMIRLDTTLSPEEVRAFSLRYKAIPGPHYAHIIYLRDQDISSITKLPEVIQAEPISILPSDVSEDIWPIEVQNGWTCDHFGPLVIPGKGQVIRLDSTTIPLFSGLIRDFEEPGLIIAENRAMIDGKPADTYKFRMDYYFVGGDNWHNSSDSRHWGLVPEDHLIGRALMVIYNPKHGRLFQRIR